MSILSRRKNSYLKKQIAKYKLDESICFAIYAIESTSRPFWFRLCEDVYFIFNFILNKLMKIPIKNLTIGVFQVGLTSIMKCNGKTIWQYYDYLPTITFKEFFLIIKAMSFKGNVDVFCKKISTYGKNEDMNITISKYGTLYNGRDEYILMLNNETKRMAEHL